MELKGVQGVFNSAEDSVTLGSEYIGVILVFFTFPDD